MKSDPVHMKTILRNLVLPLLLLSGMPSPLLANEMWQEMFNENLENAGAGDIDAQYELGVMYLKGQGVEQNRKQAMQWLQKASDRGSSQATSKLLRVKKQQAKFAQCAEKAQSGDIKAQYEVAMMYLKGKGVSKDTSKARKWLSTAAEKNDAKAITRLGIVNYKGEAGPSDYARALKLFNRVGDSSTLAQYYLGEIYANGAGVKKDYVVAINWYKKSADGGFDRSQGKIINLEEELRVENLRQKKAATRKAKQQKVALQKAEQLRLREQQAARQQATKKALVVVAKVAPSAPAKPKPVVVQVKKSPLEKLAGQQWLRGKKPLEYLPSKLTQCDEENGDLVCLSQMLTRERGTQTVRYRVKSFIRSENDTFVIVYRNLVLDVEYSQEPDEQSLGYDDEAEQGFKVKTGWTKEHSVSCKQSSGRQLNCIKDQTYKIRLVSDAG